MIIPAIISNDNIELNDALKKAKLVSNFAQIDVMDGEFVENKSNFFNLKIDDISLHLEAHLMVNEPYLWIKKNIKKFDTILTPIETTKNIEQVISFVKENGVDGKFKLWEEMISHVLQNAGSDEKDNVCDCKSCRKHLKILYSL